MHYVFLKFCKRKEVEGEKRIEMHGKEKVETAAPFSPKETWARLLDMVNMLYKEDEVVGWESCCGGQESVRRAIGRADI